jgi:hypothetical protein
MMEKFLLIVINISLPPSFFTQLDDDVLSDNIIENINNQNLSWVAGRTFQKTKPWSFWRKELSTWTKSTPSTLQTTGQLIEHKWITW